MGSLTIVSTAAPTKPLPPSYEAGSTQPASQDGPQASSQLPGCRGQTCWLQAHCSEARLSPTDTGPLFPGSWDTVSLFAPGLAIPQGRLEEGGCAQTHTCAHLSHTTLSPPGPQWYGQPHGFQTLGCRGGQLFPPGWARSREIPPGASLSSLSVVLST